MTIIQILVALFAFINTAPKASARLCTNRSEDDERMLFAYSTNDVLLQIAPDPAGKAKSPSKRSKEVV